MPFQFHYPSIFATCYPFPEIFTSFPFPPNRANSPFYPSVRSSSPTYFTSTFIYNSADGLVYPSTLSGEVLCDTLRLVWCVCVRPSLCPPPMVSRYNLRTDFKFCPREIWLFSGEQICISPLCKGNKCIIFTGLHHKHYCINKTNTVFCIGEYELLLTCKTNIGLILRLWSISFYRSLKTLIDF